MREIADFVDSLARAEMPRDDLVNIYKDSVRCENLTRWLKRMGHQRPAVLLVGEAPGKKGAAITGVPFVSPDVLMRGPKGGDPWSAFGTEAGYQYMNPSREGTATMFWEVMARYFGECPLPMTWNAVPFWPVGSDGRNRCPTPPERELGGEWLHRLTTIYRDALLVAVGRHAQRACGELGLHHESVQHPANSGKPEFEKGVRRIAASLCPSSLRLS